MLQKAVHAHKAGRFQDAYRLYTAILSAQPKHADANHNMGVLVLDFGKAQEALSYFRRALEENQATAQYWLSYINTLIKLEKLYEAKSVLDKARRVGIDGHLFDSLEQRLQYVGVDKFEVKSATSNEEHPRPNILDNLKLDQAIRLAKKRTNDGASDEARRIYTDILKRFPKNKRARGGLNALSGAPFGKAFKGKEPPQEQLQSLINLYNQGQFQQALDQVDTLVQQFPTSATLLNLQGALLQGTGWLDLSIEAYTKALAIMPDYAQAHNNMGVALKKQGKLTEAMYAYDKALAIKPDYSEAFYNAGVTLQEQGKLSEAMEAYGQALAIEPNYAEAYNNMGVTLEEQGEIEEAIEFYNKALAIKPDFADTIVNLQSLSIQLLPIISNYQFDNNYTNKNSKLTYNPRYLIQNALKAFLEADFSEALSHNNNFKACNPRLLDKLEPNDKVFCNAYSVFLEKLSDIKWDNAPVSNTENKVYHLGESHCLSYAYRNIVIGGSNFKIIPRITFGAKAFHFSRKRHDKFKAITKAHFLSLPKNSNVFLSYGEIDCRPNEGFISAARKLDKSLEELTDQTTEGYVEWFLEQNADRRHRLYFVGVPAPVYNKKHSADLNSEVARTVALFNIALEKYSLKCGFDMVDVFKFTAGKDGFSNGLFHVDNRHLGASAISKIEQQLT